MKHLVFKRDCNTVMKEKVQALLLAAARRAHEQKGLPSAEFPPIEIDIPKIDSHGDLSTNFAMVMAAVQQLPPRKIAEIIVDYFNDPDDIIASIDIAGPGFINFFIKPAAWHPVLRQVHEQNAAFGSCNVGGGRKIQVEFVSANPTGPLHVGHGRGAAVGDSMANILAFCGYDVKREYYINDSGRQIRTLGRSVFLRYQALLGRTVEFPEDCYQGDYIIDIAKQVISTQNDALLHLEEEQALAFCARTAAETILADIQADLHSFGIDYDCWYSEQSLFDSGRVDTVLKDLRRQNIIYEKDRASWFKTSRFGDEKDRVVIRNNGLTTYFASDIAYHRDKFERGFDRTIDVWGADHHGYIPRMTSAIAAMGYDRKAFDVILVQLVNLLRGGEPVAMSTRSGEFVTLKDVIAEVGRDAARFIFLTRHHESPLDFDMDVAKQKTNENPVYYVQYVHARISSILRKGENDGVKIAAWSSRMSSLLTEPEEILLIKILSRFPETVKTGAELMEPHRITFYLMNLAGAFHAYYNKHRVLTDDIERTGSRLYLITAVQKVIRNGLNLLGVSAPDSM